MVEDCLGDEVGHDLGDRGVVLPAAIKNVLHDFVELIHFNYSIQFHIIKTHGNQKQRLTFMIYS